MELSSDVERIMKKYLDPSYSWDREPPQIAESPFKKVGAQLDEKIKQAKEESDRYLRQYLYKEESQVRNINNSIRTSQTQNLFDEAPLYTSSYISPEPSPSLPSYPAPSSYQPPLSKPPPSSFPPPFSYHPPSSVSPLSASYPPPPSSFPPAPSSYPPPSPTYFSNVVEGRSDPDEFYRKMLYSTDFEDYYKSDKPVRFETPRKTEDFEKKYGDLPKLKETEKNIYSNRKVSFEDENEKKKNVNIFGDEEKNSQIKNDPYLQDDFGGIFEKPFISKSKFKETQEKNRNEVKFFEEIKSPLELTFEYPDKASEKKREDWNDFEHFEELPNNEKIFTKPDEPIFPIVPTPSLLPPFSSKNIIQERQNQSMEKVLKGLILLVLILIFLIIINKIFS